MSTHRVPQGIPTGGQFAATIKADDQDLELVEPQFDEADFWENVAPAVWSDTAIAEQRRWMDSAEHSEDYRAKIKADFVAQTEGKARHRLVERSVEALSALDLESERDRSAFIAALARLNGKQQAEHAAAVVEAQRDIAALEAFEEANEISFKNTAGYDIAYTDWRDVPENLAILDFEDYAADMYERYRIDVDEDPADVHNEYGSDLFDAHRRRVGDLVRKAVDHNLRVAEGRAV